ncbi:MAG: 3-dehydroquinate synthase [Rhodospirillales bacterium]
MSRQDVSSLLPALRPLRVDLGDRAYDIHIGEGLLAEAGRLIRPLLAQPRVAIVTDANVAPLYLHRLEAALADAGVEQASIVLPAGEPTKSFHVLEDLVERLLALRIERRTVLVALGGGVIGDLAGFAAGILLRGLDFVQIPTTLLAQVDSAVGGKTGINSRHGKNLVGLFHQPRLVIVDVGTLASLGARQLRAGYAEVVKYGAIGDAPFFAWLEANGPALLAGDATARTEAVRVSCRAKAAIVAADEREGGIRALLNLGHTFGHALEAETGFGDKLLHGEAVALGMVLAFDLSVRLGHCDAAAAARVREHLAASGLPTDLSFLAGTPVQRLIEHMQSDKKVLDGRLTFILARRIGDAFIDRSVPEAAVRSVLAAALTT